jgi:ankyrin repeat protein
MNQAFLKLIQRGATAEVADAIEADPSLAQYRDTQGVSAVIWAVYAGQPLARDFLLQKLAAQGVPLDVFEAASVGDDTRLKAILDAEPEAVSAVSDDGWTALHLASAFGTAASVDLLVARGARVDAVARNAQCNQPLHAALALGRNDESIRILLAHGADANATQAGGFTPIFSATAANRRDLAELLLAQGANPHHTSDQGKTPADFARERGHSELAAWLDSLPAH